MKIKNMSIQLRLFLFLILFFRFLSLEKFNTLLFIKSLIALVTAVGIDCLLCFLQKKKFKINESPLISGLIVGFVLASSLSWWLFSLAAAFSILSKYIIRFKGRHIFNPAALGIFLVVAFFGATTQWNGAYSWYIIIPVGLYFAKRIRKLSIVFTYFLTYILMSAIMAYLTDTYFLDQISYANYFFIFIMLIEPKTSPFLRIEKIVFAVIVNLLAFALYFVELPFDALLPALLISNFAFCLYTTRSS